MTNQEAQFILNAYRPGGHDASEPLFGDALQQARQDPALGAWLAREQAHAGTIAGKLREMAPPPTLRAAILAGARMSETPVRVWWTRPTWLAVAAAVAILLTVSSVWSQRGSVQMARLTNFAVEDMIHGQHGGHGAPMGALATLLSQPSTRLSAGLPVDFATLRATGCRTLSLAGHDVLEVCFARGGNEFHLYMVQNSDFPRLPTGEELGTHDSAGFASWADAAHHYVVVSNAGIAAIKGLL
jgi:hypothetical protein